MNSKEYKECPYCHEKLEPEASQCRHCQSILIEGPGEDLDPKTGQSQYSRDSGSSFQVVGKSLTSCGCLLTLLITLPVIIILLIIGC